LSTTKANSQFRHAFFFIHEFPSSFKHYDNNKKKASLLTTNSEEQPQLFGLCCVATNRPDIGS
jgi:hypothetical protein